MVTRQTRGLSFKIKFDTIKDMRKDLILPIIALVILVGILVLGTAYTKPGFVGLSGGGRVAEGENKLPPGPQTYQIVSSENAWPKFVEATIDPLDVKPGDLQKMRVVLQDTVDVTEVVAEIETDNGVRKISLKRTGQSPVTDEDLKNQRYFVKDGRLTVADEGSELAVAKRIAEQLLQGFIGVKPTNAASGFQKFVYEGLWVVRDTHTKTYHTKFLAKNSSGQESFITLSWTDPCNPPPSGDWRISASESCTNVTNGAEGGDIILNSGGSLTLTNSTIVWNPGKSMRISGGSIAIGASAQFRQSRIWVQDNDSDWTAGANKAVQDTQPVGYISPSGGTPGTLGPFYAAPAIDQYSSSFLVSWNNALNIGGAPDGLYMTVSLAAGQASYGATSSHPLSVNPASPPFFAVSFPPASVITGLQVDIYGYYTTPGGGAVDNGDGGIIPGVLSKGVVTGSQPGFWESYNQPLDLSKAPKTKDFPLNSPQWISYGGPGDLWGASFLNVSGIGGGSNYLLNIRNRGTGSATVYIDSIRFTYYYRAPSIISPLPDCNDNNNNVSSVRGGAFTVATTTNSPTLGAFNFDYDCDGVETLDDTSQGTGPGCSGSCQAFGSSGWVGSPPPCGVSDDYYGGAASCDLLDGACYENSPPTIPKTQACY